MAVKMLPTFKEYTVDERLREFRNTDLPFVGAISFDSKEGMKLLKEMKDHGGG